MAHRFICQEAVRLDKAIAAQTRLSRNRARTLITRGGVRVDGKVVERAEQIVPQGARVDVRAMADPRTQSPLPVRYRDQFVVVVDKPCGLPSQVGRDGGRDHVHGIVAGNEPYAGLHHRLDTPASGLLILAVDKAANAGLAKGFREGTIHRTYLAVVLGDPGPKGRWEEPLDGDEARTRWKRRSSAEGVSVLEVELDTGRTHQIRRHAADAGFPIIGDRRYGGAAGRAWPRLALHAARLALEHPVSGKPLAVDSPVPEDLQGLFAQAGFASEE